MRAPNYNIHASFLISKRTDKYQITHDLRTDKYQVTHDFLIST